ncbi:hypothetical protein ACTWKB_08925 [Bacillus sp. 4A_MP2]
MNDPVFIEIEETLALQSQNAELKEDSVTGQWIPVVAAALRLLISQVGKKGMQKGWKVARPYVQKALKALKIVLLMALDQEAHYTGT